MPALLCLALFGWKKISGQGPSEAPSAPASGNSAVAPGSAPAGGSIPGSLSLDLHSSFRNYPLADTFTYDGRALAARYRPDSLLNARTALYLQRYRPEAGVILACDLRSARVLAVGERRDSLTSQAPRMAFLGAYPAASLAKILTAAAAFDQRGSGSRDSIPVLGSYYTLYRRQLRCGDDWSRLPKITILEAFAKSVNPAFGVLGQSLGAEALRRAAERLGFNRAAVPALGTPSRIEVPDTGYHLAEISCGFTGKTTISPWHALQIARGAGDDGRLRACVFAPSLHDLAGNVEIQVPPDTGSAFISAAGLPKLQDLMEGTVRSGTARKSFHSVLRASHLDRLVVGGKTGSLDGEDPKGRYDWFIGYARLRDDPSEGLALSIMVVHREYISVRSSVVAALLIRDWLASVEKRRKAAQSAAAAPASGRGVAKTRRTPAPPGA